VILTLDEADFSDDRNGGGQVVTLMLGSKAKMGFRSNNFYQHESLLRLMLEVLELPDRPGASDGAPSMSEFLR
jgi:hypothetical protein